MNIEEIAFKNVEELICLRNISLLAIIDFLQKDRKECLNQFAKTHNESVEILKENKELKKQLHDASIQIQELIERDIWCPSNCEKLKEFLMYLEQEIHVIEPRGIRINYNCEYDSEEDYINAMKEQSKLNTLKEILSKYKEIIGVSNEKDM